MVSLLTFMGHPSEAKGIKELDEPPDGWKEALKPS